MQCNDKHLHPKLHPAPRITNQADWNLSIEWKQCFLWMDVCVAGSESEKKNLFAARQLVANRSRAESRPYIARKT